MSTEEHWSRHAGKSGKNHRQLYGADVVDLAERYGTPLFILFEKIIARNYERYKRALEETYDNHLVCYAVKANTAYDILKLLGARGAGADVASEYELRAALDAGIPPGKIRANGNCKSAPYLEECVRLGIVINVDPEEELEVIDGIARQLRTPAQVNLRLAGFPLANITSGAIITSGRWSKFGISIQRAEQAFRKVTALPGLKPNGLMVHLGSQITDITAYYTAMDILVALAAKARAAGFAVHEIDLGGGWGIRYFGEEEWSAIKVRIRDTARRNYTWADELIGYRYNREKQEMEWIGEELSCPFSQDEFIRKLLTEGFPGKRTLDRKLREIGAPRLVIEPGRSLVGNAGVTVARIGHVAKTPSGQDIIHIDAGVNCHTFGTVVPEQLHRLEIANNIKAQEEFETFVAGNLCFTGDLHGRIKSRLNRRPQRGDCLLLYDTGAYSDFFASNANGFPRPAKIMVAGDGTPRVLEERDDAAGAFRREPVWRKEHQEEEAEVLP